MSKKEELKRQILQLTREYYNEVHKTSKVVCSRAKALLIMAAVTSMMKKW